MAEELDLEDGSSFDDSNDDDEQMGSCTSDDDGIAMEPDHHSAKEAHQRDYEVLSTEQLVTEMMNIVSDVANVMHFPLTTCRILLHHYNWNKESLLERFYEATNIPAFLEAAHVVAPADVLNPTSSQSSSSQNPPVQTGPLFTTPAECAICCLEGPLTGLQCKHYYCLPCWSRYISTKVTVDGTSQIECISSNCHILVDDERAQAFIIDENVRAQFRRLITNSFVESNRLLRWCPAPDCGRAVKVTHNEPREVKCDCGMSFCFSCAHEWHEPVNCRLLKLWLKKCSDDSETSNWINANTKECPKCKVTIEKDGGCNHMTCKNTACKAEFCWMCLGPWEPHGSSWYSCNRFDDTEAKKARDAQDKSRAALQRYLHYYNRFVNHQQSLKLEHKLYATVKTKMEQMQQQSMSWIEVQFLRKAVDVLGECRRTLMYTYAFAYYLQRDNQAEIFEGNQKDLEMATEQLSEFLERDLDNENLVTLKQKVQDKFRYVEQRRSVLLKHCAEGDERDLWKFTQ